MSLSLVTLNIERNKHWERVLPFLARVSPDVICIQEIFADEVEKIERLGYTSLFGHVALWEKDAQDRSSLASEGVALFSKLPMEHAEVYHYFRSEHPERAQSGARSSEEKRVMTDQPVVIGAVRAAGELYTVATTHFTWSERGSCTPYQERDLVNLLTYLNRYQSLILAGDLNIPRSSHKLYDRLCALYTDQVPRDIRSSIDLDYHKAGKDPKERTALARFMVDHVFTSPHYRVTEISQKCGLSDHCAFVATIEKIKR